MSESGGRRKPTLPLICWLVGGLKARMKGKYPSISLSFSLFLSQLRVHVTSETFCSGVRTGRSTSWYRRGVLEKEGNRLYTTAAAAAAAGRACGFDKFVERKNLGPK